MKWTFYLPLLLRARNFFHARLPDVAEALETVRASEKYRRIISKRGFMVPFPPYIKRSILRRFVLDNECRTLVETGTQYGDTPWYFRNDLDEVYTIELSSRLASLARERFADYPNIQIVEGDSGSKLVEILPHLKSKTLFWLDGHYSAGLTARGASDCPIYGELHSIFAGCNVPWIILIDDARSFGVDKDYPSLDELKSFAEKECQGVTFAVENDIISIMRK